MTTRPDSPAFRVFSHKDGREWRVRIVGVEVQICLVGNDGERFERRRAYRDGAEAARELEGLAQEQLAEGFVETSPPPWQALLDDLVAIWGEDDPGFDARSLEAAVLAPRSPPATEVMEAVARLARRKVARPDGTFLIDGEQDEADTAARWLRWNLPGTLPALLLSLRHRDTDVQEKVEGVLAEARPPSARAALLSVLEHPAPPLAAQKPGRHQHMPALALAALGEPEGEDEAQILRMLEHTDPRVAGAAAAVLARHATVDRLFRVLWQRRARAEREDGFADAVLKAAELRRDRSLRPELLKLQKLRKFRSPVLRVRLETILETLR